VIRAGNSKACWLLRQVGPVVNKYVAVRNILADHIRHAATITEKRYRQSEMEGPQTHNAANNSIKDATNLSCPAGNGSSKHNPNSSMRKKGCHIGYRAFFPRIGLSTMYIELGSGPTRSYKTKSAIQALKDFGPQILPSTETVEALFQTCLTEDHSQFTAVYETIYHGKADNVTRYLQYGPPAPVSSTQLPITIRIGRTYAMGCLRY